ncbi:hypothetical protein KQI84_16235 [bacterium]|nr:hypothetical protein [bacterium]
MLRSLMSLISNNFMYSCIAGVVLVVVGGLVAFKADSKWGWLVLAVGVVVILLAGKGAGLY